MANNTFANDGNFMEMMMKMQQQASSGAGLGAATETPAPAPPAPPEQPAQSVPPPSKPGREKRRFTEEKPPESDAKTAPDGSTPGMLPVTTLTAEEKAAKRAKRRSKWDVAAPDAAPTAAQLSSLSNPYEAAEYVKTLNKQASDYESFHKETRDNAAHVYATNSSLEEGGDAAKHHFDHFIPQDKLEKFNRLASGKKEEPAAAPVMDASNKGAQMLAKMGFKAGQGLGAAGTGIVAPVDAGAGNNLKLGVGTAKETWEPEETDDAFELYRKRMMLGYKHRPNPLNNPRTQYY